MCIVNLEFKRITKSYTVFIVCNMKCFNDIYRHLRSECLQKQPYTGKSLKNLKYLQWRKETEEKLSSFQEVQSQGNYKWNFTLTSQTANNNEKCIHNIFPLEQQSLITNNRQHETLIFCEETCFSLTLQVFKSISTNY